MISVNLNNGEIQNITGEKVVNLNAQFNDKFKKDKGGYSGR